MADRQVRVGQYRPHNRYPQPHFRRHECPDLILPVHFIETFRIESNPACGGKGPEKAGVDRTTPERLR
jgi:hypothetical protein